MSKFLALFRAGFQNAIVYPNVLVGSAISMTVFMIVFFELWSLTYSTGAQGSLVGIDLNTMLWYLLASEIMILSQISVAGTIAESIRDGSIAIILTKPIGHGFYKFFYAFGESLPLWAVNAGIGMLVMFLLTGTMPSLAGVGWFAVVGFLGTVLNFLISYLIGLSAIIFEDTSSLEWIYSKLLLVVGGALIPLDLFPEWLRSATASLPFSYIIYRPAMVFAGRQVSEVSSTLGMQVAWIALFTLACWILYRQVISRLSVNGG